MTRARFPDLRALLGAATYLLELAAIAASYFALAEIAIALPAINPIGTPLWPPTGVALSLLLLRGYRVWPAVFAGFFCAHAITSNGLAPAGLFETISISAAITIAGLIGAWLINRWSHGRDGFDTPADIAKCMLIFAVTAMISSGIAIAGTSLSNNSGLIVPFAELPPVWAKLWLADAAGTAIIAPVIVLWAITPLRQLYKVGAVDAAVVIAAVAVGILASRQIGSYLSGLLPYRAMFAFLIFLPLTWAGLQGSQRGAATAVLIFCGTAMWGFSAEFGSDAQLEVDSPFVLLPALSVAGLVPSLILGATVATHRNADAALISAQGQLKVQLEQTQFALQNLKKHFQIFIEGVADYAIFVLDTSGHVATWNSNAQRLIGYETAEILGKHFGVLYRPDERRKSEPNRALELAIRHGKHEVEGWRVRKDGTLFFVTGALTAIRDNSDVLLGFANILRDTTERRDAQEQLVEAREQLAMAQKMEAIGKLTGGIAHDFNNLLMIIGGNAQTFKRLLDPKLPRAIEAIQTAAKRGESLTRQLLTFSRRQHVSPTIVDLNVSIRSMRTLIESSLRGNIVYEEKIDGDIDRVKIDVAELELAIVNIAVNARDAMPNGGTFTLTVCNVKADRRDKGEGESEGFVALAFSDTGTGIPPSLLSKIFDPFFTTKEVGKGTGLGLSQVYGFAHQAGGTVQAESAVGRGTAVTIYLPVCADGEGAKDAVSESSSIRPERPVVLVVDDSAEVAEVTSSLFEHLGYDTVYRDSAEAALKFLADGARIDLIFSDIVMPGTIDGVGLANEVRSRYPGLQVMLTTGYSDAATAAPPDLRILPKPFDSDMLRSFVQEALESR
jgi:PAS domain S-box-containing protein